MKLAQSLASFMLASTMLVVPSMAQSDVSDTVVLSSCIAAAEQQSNGCADIFSSLVTSLNAAQADSTTSDARLLAAVLAIAEGTPGAVSCESAEYIARGLTVAGSAIVDPVTKDTVSQIDIVTAICNPDGTGAIAPASPN